MSQPLCISVTLYLSVSRGLSLSPVSATGAVVSSAVLQVGDGPLWAKVDAGFASNCRDYWWSNILFVNNFHPADLSRECVAQSWYLANGRYSKLPLISRIEQGPIHRLGQPPTPCCSTTLRHQPHRRPTAHSCLHCPQHTARYHITTQPAPQHTSTAQPSTQLLHLHHTNADCPKCTL